MLQIAANNAPASLEKLVQLYPQLSSVDPSLMQYLQGKAGKASYYNYGDASNQGTSLLASGAGMPSYGSPLHSTGSTSGSNRSDMMSTGLSLLNGSPLAGFKKGGPVDHQPEFITGKTGNYVQGKGDGQSDDIPAMLANGEYVFDADVVSALGNGSNEAGAKVLDKMRENIRKHKRSAAPGKIPPPAKSPLAYMKG